jgi:hypothetical protein
MKIKSLFHFHNFNKKISMNNNEKKEVCHLYFKLKVNYSRLKFISFFKSILN